jgi:DNA-binding SARP family transcriptional activator
MRLIADAARLAIEACNSGDFNKLVRHLRRLAQSQGPENVHHLGVTMLNLAGAAIVQDDDSDALQRAQASIDALETTSGRLELINAVAMKATALARQGDIEGALRDVTPWVQDGDVDVCVETAQFVDSFGDPRLFSGFLDSARSFAPPTDTQVRVRALVSARHDVRIGRYEQAERWLSSLGQATWADIAFEAARLIELAHLAVARGDANAVEAARSALSHADAQNAYSWRRLGEILLGCAVGGDALNDAVRRVGRRSPWHISFFADEVTQHLADLGKLELEIVRTSLNLHPRRWRFVLRRRLDSTEGSMPEAMLLEEIGEIEDVARLRRYAKSQRRRADASNLGRALSRRVAEAVYVEDQGRVSLRVGARSIPGSEIRRKVLALLCFLLTRPKLSATRDQVLDALWPDLDPDIAVNSLNQTLYFLRRVFEEHYSEDLSPGYVHHDSEVIWLDEDLVTSRSVKCRRFVRELRSPAAPDEVEQLVDLYQGRFALDFEYEEWSAAHRDALHASYLEIVERAVIDDLSTGHYERGIRVARRALEIDPTAEQIEVCLLRLYRLTGAHAAAAEQYAHYASVMRDELGLEPPPLETL